MKPNKSPKREEKDGQLDKLKSRVRNLEKENQRLKSELNSYEQAFKKTTKFIKDNTKNISLEKLIQAANDNKTLKQVQKENSCDKCGGTDLYIAKIPAGLLTLCRTCKNSKVDLGGELDGDNQE